MSKTKKGQKAKNLGKRLIILSEVDLSKILKNQGISIEKILPVVDKTEIRRSTKGQMYRLFNGIIDDDIANTMNIQYSGFGAEVMKASIELLYSYFDIINLNNKRWHFNSFESIFLDLKNL